MALEDGLKIVTDSCSVSINHLFVQHKKRAVGWRGSTSTKRPFPFNSHFGVPGDDRYTPLQHDNNRMYN